MKKYTTPSKRSIEKLRFANRAHVKGRTIDPIEGKTMDKAYVKLVEKDGPLPKVLMEWSRKEVAGITRQGRIKYCSGQEEAW